MSDNPSAEMDLQRLQQACEALGEHFDTVHIFVTRLQDAGDEKGTMNASVGTGNWFARKGQIGDWVVKQEEISRIDMRKEHED